MVKCPYCSYEG